MENCSNKYLSLVNINLFILIFFKVKKREKRISNIFYFLCNFLTKIITKKYCYNTTITKESIVLILAIEHGCHCQKNFKNCFFDF